MDRDPLLAKRLRLHAHLVELEVLPLKRRLLLRPERPQYLERFVRATGARLRVDAAGPPLVRILAADADAQHEATERELIEHRALERDGCGMPQRKQEDAGHELYPLRGDGDGREVDQSIVANAVERHVIAGEQAVDAGRLRLARRVQHLLGRDAGAHVPGARWDVDGG